MKVLETRAELLYHTNNAAACLSDLAGIAVSTADALAPVVASCEDKCIHAGNPGCVCPQLSDIY
jgi:hypothetical protein